jgi:hypothetical protein
MKIYITDKTGKKFWNTSVAAGYAQGERNNLKRHLAAIKSGHRAYTKCGVDAASAALVEECDDALDISDDDLLAALDAVPECNNS